MTSVGERIRQAREAKGWTQMELASAVGMNNRSMASRWERDEAVPRGSTRLKIATALGVCNEWVRTGEGPMMVSNLDAFAASSKLNFEGIASESLTEEEMAPIPPGVLGNCAEIPFLNPACRILEELVASRGINLSNEEFNKIAILAASDAIRADRQPLKKDVLQAMSHVLERD